MAHFEIRDLSFAYATAKGKLSLEKVSLDIQRGEYLVLCGRSGSGLGRTAAGGQCGYSQYKGEYDSNNFLHSFFLL